MHPPFRFTLLCAPTIMLVSSLLTSLTQAATIPQGILAPPSHHQKGKLGAVASESNICSRIGIEVLEVGGNAADAMVATTFCVGVIGMYHSGLGGGGFLLVRSAAGSYESVDFRETAPASAWEDMYANDTEASVRGGLASGVPGELRGMEYLHKSYGVLPWARLLRPAIQVARYGFQVTEDLVRMMDYAGNNGDDFLTKDPNWAIDFAPNGRRLGLGDTILRKRYADTLEVIAEKGADAFYTGAMAEAMIETVQKANGTMTMEDLRDYAVELRKPVNIRYRGYNITSTGSPSSGTVVLAALKTLECYDDFGTEKLNLSTHRLDEAIRFAYGQRTNFGDPPFVKGMTAYETHILNSAIASLIRHKISDAHTLNVSAYNPSGIETQTNHGTSHISTADRSGLAITMTTTINLLFGSKVMVPETGVILNDEMNDFSIPGSPNAFGYVPSPVNYVRPGKRPLSSICPTIVEHANGSLYFVTGAAGGSRIITATLQSIVNVLDFGMTGPEALKAGRLHDQLLPNQVSFEYNYDNGTVEFMVERGHNVTWVGPGQSSVQAVRILEDGAFEAAAEPRQKNSGGFVV